MFWNGFVISSDRLINILVHLLPKIHFKQNTLSEKLLNIEPLNRMNANFD